jgi:hypothetical protein
MGIKRLHRSSGTDDPQVFADIEHMVDALIRKADRENDLHSRQLLHDLHEGKVTFLSVLETYQDRGFRGLNGLAKQIEAKKYAANTETFVEYLNGRDLAEATKTGYENHFRTFAHFLTPDDALPDLPDALKRYQVACIRLNRNRRAFNQTKAILQGWVNEVLGDDSETYKQLRKVKALEIPKKHASNPYYSPTDIKNILAYLPQPLAEMAWFQALHGMNAKEMLVDGFEVDGSALTIFGQKNDHRNGRVTPLMMQPPEIVTRTYSRYHNWLRRASRAAGFPKFASHDLRRSFVRWCVRAGIPKESAEQYGGWKPSIQVDEYIYSDPNSELQQNREKFQAWLTGWLAEHPPKTEVEPLAMTTTKVGLYGKRVTMMDAMRSESSIPKPYRPRSGLFKEMAGM